MNERIADWRPLRPPEAPREFFNAGGCPTQLFVVSRSHVGDPSCKASATTGPRGGQRPLIAEGGDEAHQPATGDASTWLWVSEADESWPETDACGWRISSANQGPTSRRRPRLLGYARLARGMRRTAFFVNRQVAPSICHLHNRGQSRTHGQLVRGRVLFHGAPDPPVLPSPSMAAGAWPLRWSDLLVSELEPLTLAPPRVRRKRSALIRLPGWSAFAEPAPGCRARALASQVQLLPEIDQITATTA